MIYDTSMDLYPRYDWKGEFIGNYTDSAWDLIKIKYSNPLSYGVAEDPLSQYKEESLTKDIPAQLDNLWTTEGNRREFICPDGVTRKWQQVINGQWVDVSKCVEPYNPTSSITSNCAGKGQTRPLFGNCCEGLVSRFNYSTFRDECVDETELNRTVNPPPIVPPIDYNLLCKNKGYDYYDKATNTCKFKELDPTLETKNFLQRNGLYIGIGILILFVIIFLMRK